jgi:Spy/CpxP family protein refolding chaperone
VSVQRILILVVTVGIWLQAVPCAAGRTKWWLSKGIEARLGLTSGQVETIEHIFEQANPTCLHLRRALDDLESAFERAMSNDQDARAASLVSRVESARAAHNIARTTMLLRIYRVLTPEQRIRLKGVRDRTRIATGTHAPEGSLSSPLAVPQPR